MITLELTVEEINLILNALGARPYNETAALITKIFQIGQDAVKASEAPKA